MPGLVFFGTIAKSIFLIKLHMNNQTRQVFLGNIYVVMLIRLSFVMLLFSVSRVIFYLLNTDMFIGITPSHFLNLMVGGLRFDLTATLYTNIIYIVGNILPFRFRYQEVYQKVLKWIFIGCNSFAFAINSIDFIYYRFTLRRTTWSVVHEFSNERGNFPLFGQFIADYWYILLIWIALIASLVLLYRQVKLRPSIINSHWIYYPVYILLMAASGGLFIAGVRGGFRYSTRPITISNAAAYVNKPTEIGIVLNTPFSIYRTLERSNYKKPDYFKTEQELEAVYSPIHTPPHDSLSFSPKNVVIFIIESMSKEYIGSLNRDLDNGNYRGYTPFLDSLIAHSYTYQHSFANGGKSIDAMPSVLASIPSFTDPYVLSVYSNNTIKGLAALLGEKGYDCSFFHGAPNGSMGFDAFARMSGFQHYYGKTEYNNDADFDGRWGIWDEPFFQFFAQTLNQKQEPFLGALFSVTSHHPYIIPDEYAGQFPKGTEEIHQCIGYTDMALRRFFETASQMPWFNNTLFVLTADHTNQVSYDKSKTSLGRLAIPIIFYDPSGNLKGLDQSRTAQQIDIMPTVLNYLHYDQPYFAFGFDALAKDTSRAFVINYNGAYQIVHNNYVLETREDGPVALYQYTSDYLQLHNLKDQEPEIVQALNNKFKAFIQQYNGRLIENRMRE